MFNISSKYTEIKKELELNNILTKIAKFECLSDGIVTYSYNIDNTEHEFNIIAFDDLNAEMKIYDLINLKRIIYFEHAVYIDTKKIGSCLYKEKYVSF